MLRQMKRKPGDPMAKKKEFTPELQRHVQHAGHDWRYFELIQEYKYHIIARNIQTKETILVRKVRGL